MTNLADTPNRILIGQDYTFSAHFGDLYAAVPMHHVNGLGHDQEHVRVHFYGGMSMELTRAAAIELARRLPEAVAALPVVPDCSGALARVEEVDG